MATIDIRTSDVAKAANNVINSIKIVRDNRIIKLQEEYKKQGKFYNFFISFNSFKRDELQFIKRYRNEDLNIALELLLLCELNESKYLTLNTKEAKIVYMGLKEKVVT